ncbi:MAG: Trk system potassium transporter TrkA [Clostridiales bacterium]|nr:Trk system potassium transporter TrkA [Clostridiales bacterium]
MKIIIVGDGKVGFYLAETLSKENHDVIIIDKSLDTLKSTMESLDVMGICGNGASTRILQEAGVRGCDLLIAATSMDELNMVCCLTAKRLGAKHVVARIRDIQYADELASLAGVLGLDQVINPESLAAGEVARMLQFPPAINVDTFARGKVEMVELKVELRMDIADMDIKAIARKHSTKILIAAIMRDGRAIIPNGDVIVRPHDRIYVFGLPAHIDEFCARLGMQMQKIRNAMIVGGGLVGYYLAKELREIGIKVKLVEISRKRCEEISNELPSAIVINGDGTEPELLHSESLGEMDAFVSLTGHDEDNLMSVLLAKSAGVSKAIAKISRTSYSDIIRGLGIDYIVNTKVSAANSIINFARGLQNAKGSQVKTLYRIVDSQAEALEFAVSEKSRLVGVPLKSLSIKKEVLIAALTREDNQTVIPHGNDKIRAGDHVIVVARNEALNDLDDILA